MFSIRSRAVSQEIHELHVNFWFLNDHITRVIDKRLQRPFLRPLVSKTLYVDLGFLRKSTNQSVELLVELPPSLRVREIQDVSDRLADDKTAELVFGTAVRAEAGFLYLSGKEGDGERKLRLRPAEVDLANGHAQVEVPRSTGARVSRGTLDYTRVRLVCDSYSPFLEDRGWGLAKKGYTFTARFFDVRQDTSSNIPDQFDKFARINSLMCFAILSAAITPQVYSPDIYYARVLESEHWKEYLGHGAGVRCPKRSIIYSWRFGNKAPDRADAITVHNPARIYAQFILQFGFSLLGAYILAGAIGGFVGRELAEWTPSDLIIRLVLDAEVWLSSFCN